MHRIPTEEIPAGELDPEGLRSAPVLPRRTDPLNPRVVSGVSSFEMKSPPRRRSPFRVETDMLRQLQISPADFDDIWQSGLHARADFLPSNDSLPPEKRQTTPKFSVVDDADAWQVEETSGIEKASPVATSREIEPVCAADSLLSSLPTASPTGGTAQAKVARWLVRLASWLDPNAR